MEIKGDQNHVEYIFVEYKKYATQDTYGAAQLRMCLFLEKVDVKKLQ